tara:strand:- start:402 stop:587 length:186 start_codon:yes stop_codon:yes gene_type:complete
MSSVSLSLSLSLSLLFGDDGDVFFVCEEEGETKEKQGLFIFSFLPFFLHLVFNTSDKRDKS